MANLTVWKFGTATGAKNALTNLAEFQRQHHVIRIDAQEVEQREAFGSEREQPVGQG
jgi:hypothetical protein